jgi:hypothetical protein
LTHRLRLKIVAPASPKHLKSRAHFQELAACDNRAYGLLRDGLPRRVVSRQNVSAGGSASPDDHLFRVSCDSFTLRPAAMVVTERHSIYE